MRKMIDSLKEEARKDPLYGQFALHAAMGRLQAQIEEGDKRKYTASDVLELLEFIAKGQKKREAPHG